MRSCWPSSPRSSERLTRPPLLDTPDGALNRAFARAVERSGASVRAESGAEWRDWDASDLAHLLEEAERFRRVGPDALPDPAAFLREVVGGLFGVRAEGEGGRFEMVPWRAEGWRSMAIRRLRCHRTLLDIEVRPRAEWVTVRVEVSFGPPIAVALGLRNVGELARITVDEIPLEGAQQVGRAVFTASGQHEVVFFLHGEAL